MRLQQRLITGVCKAALFGAAAAVLPIITPSSASVQFLPEQGVVTTLRVPDYFKASLVWTGTGAMWPLNADQAIMISCIVPWSSLKSGVNETFHLIGNAASFTLTRAFGISFTGPQATNPYRARLYWKGEAGGTTFDQTLDLSATKPKHLFLVMRKVGGATPSMYMEAYSDGVLLATSGAQSGTFTASKLTTQYFVGAQGTTASVYHSGNSINAWPGAIDFVGLYNGTIAQADCEAISGGSDPLVQLTAANFAQYRVLTDTVTSLSAPAGATGDVTSAWTFSGAVDPKGGNCRPVKSGATSFTTTAIRQGFVWSILPGQTTATVTLSGNSVGLTGGVDARFFNRDGQLIKDWTALTGADLTSGTWSGTVTVPANSGWGWADTRPTLAPSMVFALRGRFGVGYKVGFMGQSQIALAFGITAAASTLDADIPFSVALADVNGLTTLNVVRQAKTIGDSIAACANLARHYTTAPICLVEMAEVGTGMDELMWDGDDGAGKRKWSSLVTELLTTGSDISAIVINWCTNNQSTTANALRDNYLHPLISGPLGAQPLGSGYIVNHFLRDGTFPATMKIALSLPTRHTTAAALGPYDQSGFTGTAPGAAGTYTQSAWQARQDYLTYPAAYPADGVIMGPSVSDMYIDFGNGPHEPQIAGYCNLIYGGPRLLLRMMIAGFRALGLDTTIDPTISGAVLTSPTTIVATVSLRNGGTLQTQWATAAIAVPGGETTVQGFEISTNGGTTWTRSGFTAEITDAVNARVTLTKTAGTWVTGVKIRYLQNGPLDYGAAANQAGYPTSIEGEHLVHGMLCEGGFTNAAFFENGIGLPVLGLSAPLTL